MEEAWDGGTRPVNPPLFDEDGDDDDDERSLMMMTMKVFDDGVCDSGDYASIEVEIIIVIR